MATGSMTTVLKHLRRLALQPDGRAPTDGQLLGRYLDHGDETAFEELLHRHGAMVLGVCRRLLGPGADAEDAFQATFLVLVRKGASVVPRDMVGNWLYGVAHRTALEARTLAARRRAREKPMDPLPESEMPPEDQWRELRPLLDEELSRLPAKYRAPVVLCDLEGKTQMEAARQLGCPEGTVAGRLFRARSLLMQRLRRRHAMVFSAGSLALLLTEQNASAVVSPVLAHSTMQAATLVAAGQAATAELISAPVVALTEGVIKAMALHQIKLATAVLLTLGVMGTGAGVLTHQAFADRPVAQLSPDQREPQAAEQNADEQPRKRAPEETRRIPDFLPLEVIEKLKLSDEQKKEVAKLMKEFQERREAAEQKFNEALEQAKQNQDRDKAKEAGGTFRMEIGKLHEDFNTELQQLLTDEQKRRLGELQRQRPPEGRAILDGLLRVLAQLDLSEEQKEKVGKLIKDFEEKRESAEKKTREAVEQAKQNQDGEKVRELIQTHGKEMAKLLEGVHNQVVQLLTDEQKKKLADVEKRRSEGMILGLGQLIPPPIKDGLGLTPEQREKVANLQREMEEKLRGILTDEQNKKFEELKKGSVPTDRPKRRE
jgi:RNA polymerase sigma factor (sigma-70 family)